MSGRVLSSLSVRIRILNNDGGPPHSEQKVKTCSGSSAEDLHQSG